MATFINHSDVVMALTDLVSKNDNVAYKVCCFFLLFILICFLWSLLTNQKKVINHLMSLKSG